MRQESEYSIPIVVLLALIFAIASDYCRPFPSPNETAFITTPAGFNPFCYVAGFHPEQPELRKSSPVPQYRNLMVASATGTAVSGTTISASPSPSFEIPEKT